MLDESASALSSSTWASLNSWFTPTVLFVLLNLVIATIAVTSSLPNQLKSSQNDPHKPNTSKSPSLLQRLKSINSHTHFRSQEPQNPSVHHKPNPDSETLFNIDHTHESIEASPQLQYFFQENLETHFDFDEKEIKSDGFQQACEEKAENMDGGFGDMKGSHCSRTKSDTLPASGEVPTKLPSRMRKSASLKSPFAHFEEDEIVETRRPATAGGAKATDGDEEVDAKADDFINRFKQQLKLQRLDSIVRYKDMIGRGK